MHGVKRVGESREAGKARKQREQSKIKEHIALTEDILSRKKRKDWSQEALELTTRMIQLNPEFYTVWNYRRNIFLQGIFPSSSPQEINELLSTDLWTTTAALKAHPKVYWIWNHRRWCLENIPDGPGEDKGWKKAKWDEELYVVERMLDRDARNFHAWGYRRYVLGSMPVARPQSSELAYTTRKIEANFSNFSAWHQRSKVYTSLWESGQQDRGTCLEQELELVRNAMYTDPNDQSVWVYHRWLIGAGEDRGILADEIRVIQELLEEQPDSKWCMESLVHYKRLMDGDECVDLLRELERIDPARRARYKELGLGNVQQYGH